MSAVGAVNVIVPVLDGERTIGDTLDALKSQASGTLDIRVLVVDNGSTDGTVDVVRRFDVELLHEPRRGPAAARNRGIRAADGEVLAFLDADTLPTRRWLTELVAPFEDASVMLAGGRLLPYRPESPVEKFLCASGHFEPENTVKRPVFPFVPSGNLAVRRDAALGVGGFCEEMMTAEDVDFSQRIQREFDTGIHYCPRAVLFVRNRTDDVALSDQAWSYGEGAADVYRRYPEEVAWGWAERLHVARVVLTRGAASGFGRWGRLCGGVSDEHAEFYRYHALWTWWWWRGFFSMRRHAKRRPRP